eukprot:5026-Heterococcus_DN1.PRE.2
MATALLKEPYALHMGKESWQQGLMLYEERQRTLALPSCIEAQTAAGTIQRIPGCSSGRRIPTTSVGGKQETYSDFRRFRPTEPFVRKETFNPLTSQFTLPGAAAAATIPAYVQLDGKHGGRKQPPASNSLSITAAAVITGTAPVDSGSKLGMSHTAAEAQAFKNADMGQVIYQRNRRATLVSLEGFSSTVAQY